MFTNLLFNLRINKLSFELWSKKRKLICVFCHVPIKFTYNYVVVEMSDILIFYMNKIWDTIIFKKILAKQKDSIWIMASSFYFFGKIKTNKITKILFTHKHLCVIITCLVWISITTQIKRTRVLRQNCCV